MSKRYTEDQKNDALTRVDNNYGDIALTSLQTGIPTRTLRDWKRKRKLSALSAFPPKKVERRRQQMATSPINDQTESTQDRIKGQYTRIHARLMEHIDLLIDTLTDDPDTAHLRVMVLSRLLDRVIKLEALTQAEGEQVIRIEYQYPDGTIHNMPPWEHPAFAPTTE